MAEKKTRVAETLFATLFGVSSLRDWLKTEDGKVAMAKISSKIFGIGPEDEALFKKACTYLLEEILLFNVDSQEAKETLEKITEFLLEMERLGYSRWWFRNVLATMRKGDKDGENQAARTLAEIIQGKDFEEMKTFAGPDLIQKTYKKKISEGWEIVTDKAGNLNLLVDIKKFPKIFSAVGDKIETAKKDFKEGYRSSFWPVILTFIVSAAIFVLLMHC